MDGYDEGGSARLKLAHAYKLHQQLCEAVSAWIETQPFKIDVDRDTGLDTGRLRIVQPRALGDPFSDWALKVADVASNARSALDHEIHRLGLRDRRNGRSPDDLRGQTGFPVFTAAAKYSQQGPTRYLVCVNDAVRRVVEAAQPFSRSPTDPDRDALAQLHWLNNAEKHRITRAGFLLLDDSVHHVTHFGPPGASVAAAVEQAPRGTVLSDGAVLFRLRSQLTHGDGSTSWLRGQLQLSLQPRFTELELPLPRMDVILRRVAQIIDALEET